MIADDIYGWDEKGDPCFLWDITGEKFNKLTAVKPVPYTPNTGVRWLFRCDCGVSKPISVYRVIYEGSPKSCGCLRIKDGPPLEVQHRQKLMSVWRGMVARCENVKSRSYRF
jgi:hypothetical protein